MVADTTCPHHAPPFYHHERQVTCTETPEALRTPPGSQEGGTDDSVGQLGLDTVDQLPQSDVDPARLLLILEDHDVVRDLGDDVTRQPKSIMDGQVSGEAVHQRTRVLVGNLLPTLDVAEHESRHGLRLEDG